jgi:ketosteroid isomerase-like protein
MSGRASPSDSCDAQVDLWTRCTACLVRRGTEWKIVHQHNSVPFLMDGSFKAAVDLKP